MDHQPVRLRMIVSWNKEKKAFVYLLTNLPQERYDIDTVCLLDKLRWQVELLCKEWTSYANRHAFDTPDAHISEAFIWASLAAAAPKRFLAHATEHLHLACQKHGHWRSGEHTSELPSPCNLACRPLLE